MKTHDPARACVSRFVFLPIQPSPRARPARARPAAGRRRTQHRSSTGRLPEGRRRSLEPSASAVVVGAQGVAGDRSARRVSCRTGPRARARASGAGSRPLGRRRRRSRTTITDRASGSWTRGSVARGRSPAIQSMRPIRPAAALASIRERARAAVPHRSRRRARGRGARRAARACPVHRPGDGPRTAAARRSARSRPAPQASRPAGCGSRRSILGLDVGGRPDAPPMIARLM